MSRDDGRDAAPEPVANAPAAEHTGGARLVAAVKARRRPLLIALKILISTALLAWILSRAALGDIAVAMAGTFLPLLIAAYSLDIIGLLIGVARWRVLLRTQATPPPTWRFLAQSYMIAAFFNNLLPSTVGGDASRSYDSYRASGGSTQAASSVVVDRLLGLLALVLFALVGLPFASQVAEAMPDLGRWLELGTLAMLGAVGLIFFGSRLVRLRAYLPARVEPAIQQVWRAFASYRGGGQWRTLVKAFGLSLLLQANVVLYFVLIAKALHLDVPAQSFFLIVPLATFVTMLPVSINGIGLRENALAVMLAWYGVGAAQAVALAWLVYLGGLLTGVAGGIVYMLRR